MPSTSKGFRPGRRRRLSLLPWSPALPRPLGNLTHPVVEQVPDPHPGPGEIRVRVAAAGVNPIDWKLRSGAPHQIFPLDLPDIPGREGAGVVDEIGDGVRGVGIGDRVLGLGCVTAGSAWARMWSTR
ncbi:alcohol dehydrogenase [Streptomyces sp. ADI96-02]|nr:alcohol dehydrogenase [Streptomyces sp. ADI96-02]